MTATSFTHTETNVCANKVWERQHLRHLVHTQHQFSIKKKNNTCYLSFLGGGCSKYTNYYILCVLFFDLSCLSVTCVCVYVWFLCVCMCGWGRMQASVGLPN